MTLPFWRKRQLSKETFISEEGKVIMAQEEEPSLTDIVDFLYDIASIIVFLAEYDKIINDSESRDKV